LRNKRSVAVRAVSFDVFDTALTRACGAPGAVFALLGRRLWSDGVVTCTPEEFARVRERAEAEVWRRAGGLDARVTLDDFHLEVCRRLGIEPSVIPRLVAAELELEAEVLRPVPGTRERIEQFTAEGVPIVFTTDTYFPRQFIEDQLRRHGLLPAGAQVFASTESDTSKAGGALFDEVVAGTGVEATTLLHVGDNPYADVEMPGRRGIRTDWFQEGQLNRYERLLADHVWESGGLSATYAGASRLARLHTPVTGARDAAIRDVACGVAAPFLVAYVSWILRRADRAELRRLYFLSRDGQIMRTVAERLVAKLGLDIDIRYLHASRGSTNLAATFRADDEELAWIERDLGELGSRDLLAKFDLDPEDVRSVAGIDGLTDAPAGSEQVRELLRALRRPGEARDLLLEKALQRRVIVTAYLGQQGLFDGVAQGIVDFGGVGSQMRALHSLISAAAPSPRLFLVGLDDPAAAGLPPQPEGPDWLADTECFLYDHRRKLGMLRRRGFGTCVQMFCAADHGTVTGYRENGDMIEPELRVAMDEELLDWGLPVLRDAVTAFVDQLHLDDRSVDAAGDARGAVTAVVDLFWTEPTRREAAAWGAFPFEGAHAVVHDRGRLAWPYTWVGVARGVRDGTFPDLGWTHWFEGSLRLSRATVRIPVSAAASLYRWLERTEHPRAGGVLRLLRRALGRPGHRD
jgi:FMN phosphatase YigB (HAD superfamily)